MSERLASNGLCLACAREFNKSFYKKSLKGQRSTPEGRKTRTGNDRAYWDRNREIIAERRRAQYQQNRETMIARRRKYYDANLPKIVALNTLIKQKRRHRAPDWLSNEHIKEIESLYHEAAALSDLTGILHHVDHIVPLLGKKVCGLHVPWNMRVITAQANLEKGNRHEIA